MFLIYYFFFVFSISKHNILAIMSIVEFKSVVVLKAPALGIVLLEFKLIIFSRALTLFDNIEYVNNVEIILFLFKLFTSFLYKYRNSVNN